jgi:hypothetical protein
MKAASTATILLLTISIFSACKNDPVDYSVKNTAGTTGGTTTTVTSDLYFKGSLNGTAFNWAVTDGLTGWVTGSASALSTDKGDVTGSLIALISASTTLQPQIGIQFSTYFVASGNDKLTYFNSFVTTGAWALATNNSQTVGTKAIIMQYTDSKGKAYTSIGTQTGASVNIVSATPVAATPGVNASLKIKLTINCALYPVDNTGGPLLLSNGEATLMLENLL